MICILDPWSCGSTKVLVYELFTSDFGVQQEGNKKVWQGNVNKKQFEKFEEHYLDYRKIDTCSCKAFVNKFPNSIENIKPLWKKDSADKKSVLPIFLADSWTNLEQLKKTKHSPTDCQVCLKLPIKTNTYRRKAFLKHFNGKKAAVLQDATNETASDLNRDFKSRFNVNFMSQATKSTKPSDIENENTARAIQKDIEGKWNPFLKSVETYVFITVIVVTSTKDTLSFSYCSQSDKTIKLLI